MDRKKSLLSRRDAIKQLIKTNAIEDQTTLIELLNKQYGIETNQPAISRDLHELQVRKGMVDGQLIYEIPDTNVEAELLKLAITDIVHNDSMIVVKTMSGLPAFAADVLDRHEYAGILGTIAGENMVFVCPVSNKPIQEVYDNVCEILYFKKKMNKS